MLDSVSSAGAWTHPSNRLRRTCGDRVRKDGTKTRTSCGKTLSSGRIALLKPSLSGDVQISSLLSSRREQIIAKALICLFKRDDIQIVYCRWCGDKITGHKKYPLKK